MSHFAVIVIGEDVEAALAPYQENNMGDCPPEYLGFVDETEDVANGWAELDESERAKHTSIAAYAAAEHGYREHRTVEVAPDEHGVERFGYLENPNAKWDWYAVGGRYAGWFPVRVGDGFGRVDFARKSAIEWEPKRAVREAAARDRFSRWKRALDEHPDAPRPLSWREVREAHGERIDEARAAYNAQAQIVTWKRIAEAHDRWETFDLDPVDDLGFDVDALVERERRRAPVPFAYVLDGKWHERGSMGWWGCVSNERDALGWIGQWERDFDALPPDALLTLVDCHI